MTPGIALIIGILIGAIIVYLLMQSKVKQKESALQQSRNRLDQLDREQEQRLSELARQLETEYEQKLAEKIERYQDKHAQQMEDLESEYEARLAVFIGVEGVSAPDEEAAFTSASPTLEAESLYAEPSSNDIPTADTPEEDKPEGTGLGGAATATVSAVTALPDPWEDQSESNTITPPSEISSATSPVSTEVAATQEALSSSYQALSVIQETLATNRRSLAQVLPTLSKLGKDPDPAIRLATVQVLKQVESIKAIPLLRQALRDPNSEVVAAASEALNRFKSMPRSTPQISNKAKKKLPKNR